MGGQVRYTERLVNDEVAVNAHSANDGDVLGHQLTWNVAHAFVYVYSLGLANGDLCTALYGFVRLYGGRHCKPPPLPRVHPTLGFVQPPKVRAGVRVGVLAGLNVRVKPRAGARPPTTLPSSSVQHHGKWGQAKWLWLGLP